MTPLSEWSAVGLFVGLPGPLELIIIAVILLLLVGVPIIVVCLVVGLSRRKGGPDVQGGIPVSSNLIVCPDCGHMVSRRARSCPNCGAPLEGPGITDDVPETEKPPE